MHRLVCSPYITALKILFYANNICDFKKKRSNLGESPKTHKFKENRKRSPKKKRKLKNKGKKSN